MRRFLVIAFLVLTGCEEPRRYDKVILLNQPEAQQRLDDATAQGWSVVEDNELQQRTDAIFLWRFMRKNEATKFGIIPRE